MSIGWKPDPGGLAGSEAVARATSIGEAVDPEDPEFVAPTAGSVEPVGEVLACGAVLARGEPTTMAAPVNAIRSTAAAPTASQRREDGDAVIDQF